jgi:hypothetical protein
MLDAELRPSAIAAVVATCLAAVVACCGGGCGQVRVLAPSARDDVAERLARAEAELASLKSRNAELEAQLRARAAHADSNATPVDPEVLANAPIAVSLAVAQGSLVERVVEGDRTLGRVVLHVQPLDGRSRFVQVVGRLEVGLQSLPAPGTEPVAIGSSALGPAALRDALRAGLFGLHYAVPCTFDLAPVGRDTSIAARVVFRDGFTGRELTAPFVVAVPPAQEPARP